MICSHDIRAPNYLRQILKDLKGEIDNTIILGDFNTPLSAMDRSSRQKIKKETLDSKHTLDQVNLTDMYKTIHPTAAEYSLLKCTQNILQDRSSDRTQNKS